MNKSFLIAFPLLFLFVFTIPAYAYFPIDLNVTYPGAYFPTYIACTNNTGTFYCYILSSGGGNPVYIERFNATWGDRKTCSVGTVGASAFAYWKGLAIANTTHLIAPQSSVAGGYRLIPIWNMTNSTVCTSTDTLTDNLFNSTTTPFSGGLDNSTGKIYWGLNNGIRNYYNNSFVGNGFWDTSSILILRFSNQSDNNTLYGATNANAFGRYVGGAYDGYVGSIPNSFGTAISYNAWDLYKENAGTTWLYSFAGSYQLLKMNFSLMESSSASGTTIEAISPINNASASTNPPVYHIQLTSNLNGTITWYLNGVSKGTTAYLTDGTTQDIYFTNPASLATECGYTWYANFTDTLNYSWYFTPENFCIGIANVFIDPLEALSQIIGSFFSIGDLNASKDVFALLASLLIATIITVLFAMNIRQTDGKSNLTIFFGVFIVMAIVFYTAGFMSAWIILALFAVFVMLIFFALKGG